MRLMIGGSGGTAVHAALVVAREEGPDAVIVVLLPDSGRNYLSKFHDDNWMLEHGFVERAGAMPTVDEILRAKHGGDMPELVTISAHAKVGEGIDTMTRYGIPQLPVGRGRTARAPALRHRTKPAANRCRL